MVDVCGPLRACVYECISSPVRAVASVHTVRCILYVFDVAARGSHRGVFLRREVFF